MRRETKKTAKHVAKARVLSQFSTFSNAVSASQSSSICSLTAKTKRTDRKLVEAEHIVDSDLRQNHTKEVGPLVGASSDQEPAVASTLRDQLARRRPFLVDEELGARLEVVKHVLLVAHGAGVAPRGAVLAPAAEVGDGDDAAIAQSKDGARDGEGRFQGDVEACCIGVDGGEGGRVAREKEREIVRERLKRKKERKKRRASKVDGRSRASSAADARNCSSDPKNSSGAFASPPPQGASA